MERKTWIMATAAFVVCAGLGSLFREAGANAVYTNAVSANRFECSDKLLKGTYGIQMQGTRSIPGGMGLEAVIGVTTRKYDGEGNFTQLDNIKGATSGLLPDRPGAGTYEVHADCTGTTRFEPGPGVIVEERFIILDYGYETRSIVTTPQSNMITTVGKRIGFR